MRRKLYVKDDKEKYERSPRHWWHHGDTVLALKCLTLTSSLVRKITHLYLDKWLLMDFANAGTLLGLWKEGGGRGVGRYSVCERCLECVQPKVDYKAHFLFISFEKYLLSFKTLFSFVPSHIPLPNFCVEATNS